MTNRSAEPAVAFSTKTPIAEVFPWVAAILVFVARAATTGGVYWQDGPAHVWSIRAGKYLIQAPGYWLWNRTGGLFPDPEFGLDFLNWIFSALSLPVFYALARELEISTRIARLATACFGAVFFVWFSGNTQSTYPSQLLFPCTVAWLLTMHRRVGNRIPLWAAALLFGIGAGFRPSDGVFLAPMMAWWLWRQRLWDAVITVIIFAAACSLWVVPTMLGMRHNSGIGNNIAYTVAIFSVVSAFSGDVISWLGNVTRVVLPLTVAFWPLALVALKGVKRLSPHTMFLVLWIAPGIAFLALVYMSTAPYLNFMVAPAILIAALGAETTSWRKCAFPICIAWNIGFYLFFVPLPAGGLPAQALNAMAGVYTYYGVTHKWAPNLSDLLGRRTLGP